MNKAGWLALALARGADFSLALTWSNPDGSPVDLTGCSARLRAWRTAADSSPAIDLVADVDAGAGGLSFSMAAAEVDALDLRSGFHAVEVTYGDGSRMRLLDGPVDVLPPGARPPRRAAGSWPVGSGTGGTVSVVDASEVRVVSVAEQGPPGPSGAEASYPAGIDLGGHRMVALAGGGLVYADADTPAHADTVVGMTVGAAAAGADATVLGGGELAEPSWAWTPDAPLYLQNNGLVGHGPPSTGFVLSVGFAISAQRIFLSLGTPVFLNE